MNSEKKVRDLTNRIRTEQNRLIILEKAGAVDKVNEAVKEIKRLQKRLAKLINN